MTARTGSSTRKVGNIFLTQGDGRPSARFYAFLQGWACVSSSALRDGPWRCEVARLDVLGPAEGAIRGARGDAAEDGDLLELGLLMTMTRS